jgi:hypothetical protein
VVTKTTKGVLAGVAVAALAATGVAAVVRYRQGQKPSPDQRAGLDELAARLGEADGAAGTNLSGGVRRVLDSLQRTQGISAGRLRQWIAGVRHGTLSDDQAAVAESDFGALEREADQGGV